MGTRLFVRIAAALALTALAGVPSGCGKGKPARVLRWGADPSGGAPFVFTDPRDPDKVIGFEVDIMERVGARLNLETQMVSNDWDTLIEALKRGDCDMVINGIEINPEREKVVLFSKPYYQYEQQLAVRKEDKDKYTCLEDLKGKRIATLTAAEANNVLKRAGWTEDLIQPMKDSQQPYDELKNGRVEAVLQEDIIAAYYVPKYAELCLVEKTFSPGRYAVAFRKEDTALAAEIEGVLDLLKENGELAAIYKNWRIQTPQQAQLGVKSSD